MEKKRRIVHITGEFNKFIEGRITGFITGVKRDLSRDGYWIKRRDNATTFTFDATNEEYDAVKELIICHFGSIEKMTIEFVEF